MVKSHQHLTPRAASDSRESFSLNPEIILITKSLSLEVEICQNGTWIIAVFVVSHVAWNRIATPNDPCRITTHDALLSGFRIHSTKQMIHP